MEGPLSLSGPVRPVPMYIRRPMGLDLSPASLLPSPSLHPAPDSLQKAKDIPMPTPPFPPSLLSRSQLPSKGENFLGLLHKPRELLPSGSKNGVPVITPVRDPDLRSVALYQSLLRHHPAYHQILEPFLVPHFSPLMCPPPSVLCEMPFNFSTGLPTRAVAPEEERSRASSLPKPEPHSPQQNTESSPRAEKAESPNSEEKGRDAGGCLPRTDLKNGGMVSAEDLVSSITAIPDPYQQYGYGRKLFPCPQCRYTTDRRNNLKRHMLTMHQLSSKLLECCGLLFRTKAALREHALIFHYHGYTCFYCARRFCRKALLKRHLSVHNGQKEFLCSVCDYATSHKSNLERHRRVHMRQDEDGVYDEMGGDHMMESSQHLSEDEISVCSHDEENEEEINVHSD